MSAPASTVRARSSSAAASEELRAASSARRAARWTMLLTLTATATNSSSASRFCGSWIVRVCSGGVRNQLSSRPGSRRRDDGRPEAADRLTRRRRRAGRAAGRRPATGRAARVGRARRVSSGRTVDGETGRDPAPPQPDRRLRARRALAAALFSPAHQSSVRRSARLRTRVDGGEARNAIRPRPRAGRRPDVPHQRAAAQLSVGPPGEADRREFGDQRRHRDVGGVADAMP